MCNLLITEAIHRGIYNANLDYEQWSCGYRWLNDSASEGLMVAGIARALHEQRQGRRKSLWLEMPFRAIRENVADQYAGCRVDIAVLDQNENPIYVIEAKRSWDGDEDLNRIEHLVQGGGLRGGVAAVLVAQNGDDHDQGLNNVMVAVANWHGQHPDMNVNICVSESWGYPMCWRFDHNYPRSQDWQNWKGASICVEIVPARRQRIRHRPR